LTQVLILNGTPSRKDICHGFVNMMERNSADRTQENCYLSLNHEFVDVTIPGHLHSPSFPLPSILWEVFLHNPIPSETPQIPDYDRVNIHQCSRDQIDTPKLLVDVIVCVFHWLCWRSSASGPCPFSTSICQSEPLSPRRFSCNHELTFYISTSSITDWPPLLPLFGPGAHPPSRFHPCRWDCATDTGASDSS
jgi:hypothetical protein